jgi:hypothetical protein
MPEFRQQGHVIKPIIVSEESKIETDEYILGPPCEL